MYEYLICRLEKIVFGDPSDVINNLLDDQSMTKIINEPVDIKNQKVIDDKNNSDQDTLILNNVEDAKPEEKKAVWVDDDDYNYTYV